MISFVIGTVGTVISLVGWFGFHSVVLLIIGTALYIVETLMEWKNLNLNAKTLDIVIFVGGCLVGTFAFSIPWYVGGMLALAIYSFAMSLIGIIAAARLKR